jgi:hypothetical protein
MNVSLESGMCIILFEEGFMDAIIGSTIVLL